MHAKNSLRADAARNRTLILDAARAAFASAGTDVSMAEIVRRAGVGYATALRRFPTKEDLIREIVADELHTLQETLLAEADSRQPWDVVVDAVRTCAAHQAGQPGLAGAIAEAVGSAARSDRPDGPAAAFTSVLRRASSSGALNDDVTLDDVVAILFANAGVIAHSPGRERDASTRFVDLALRGLRA